MARTFLSVLSPARANSVSDLPRPPAAMSVPPPGSRPRNLAFLAPGLAGLALALLLVITLAPSSATRMFAWPWALHAAAFWLLPLAFALARLALGRPDSRLGGPLDLAFAALALSGLAATAFSPLRATLAPHLLPFLGALSLPYALRPLLRSPRLDLASFAFLGPLLIATGVLWLAAPANLAAPHERNDQPFGHANATGSVCALAACWFIYLAVRTPARAWRLAHLGGAALALVHVGFSMSRGSLLALAAAALVVAALVFLRRGRLLPFLALGALTVGALVLTNPRLREAAFSGRWSGADNESNAQRLAMIAGGFALGAERPFVGWGPGAVPHVFPRVRAALPGEPDNYLQLHNTPAQLAATLGLAGLLAAAGLLVALTLRLRTALRDTARERETLALAAALACALALLAFDHPFALPAFAVLAALPVAALAPRTPFAIRHSAFVISATTLVATVVVAAVARDLAARAAWSAALDAGSAGDPAAYAAHLRRARALAPADPYFADQLASHLATGHPFPRLAAPDPAAAIPVLRAALARNPALESARYNLGWLLLAAAPSEAGAAREHFAAAARLAPARAGVYHGLAQACIELSDTPAATSALAAEILLDPAFAWSPRWREPALAPLRDAALARAAAFLSAHDLAPDFVARLAAPGEPLPAASAHRRVRTGQGVLFGHPDGQPPIDLPILLRVAIPHGLRAALPRRGFVTPARLLACAGLGVDNLALKD